MIKKIIQYIKDVNAEMHKVTWPTREEITGATALVIGLSLVIAVIVKLFDVVITKVFGVIFNM